MKKIALSAWLARSKLWYSQKYRSKSSKKRKTTNTHHHHQHNPFQTPRTPSVTLLFPEPFSRNSQPNKQPALRSPLPRGAMDFFHEFDDSEEDYLVFRHLQDEEEKRSDSTVILHTFRVYGTMYAISILLFTILNWRYPRLFNIRSWSKVQGCKLAATATYDHCVSWFWQVFSVTDIDLHEQCGMDAVCFIRAMRFGRQLTIMGCVNAVWLFPLYYTAEGLQEENEAFALETNTTVAPIDFFDRISIAHLPTSSKRFVGTLVATYINFLYTMYLIIQEYKWYTAHRHKWLSATTAHNYAVYVSGIPQSYRSNTALQSYFTQCCGAKSVLEAQIIRETPKLDKLVARRTALVHRLEHCAALERKTGVQLKHRSNNWRMVSTVQHLRAELADLNRSIQRNIHSMTASADPLRMHMARAESNLDHLLAAIQEDVQNDGAETVTLNAAAATEASDPARKLSDILPTLPGQSSRRLALGGAGSDDEDDEGTILRDDCTIVEVTDKRGDKVQAVVDEDGTLVQVLDGENEDPALKRDDSGLALLIRRNLLNGTYKVVGGVGAAVVTGAGTGFRAAGTGLAVAGNGLAVAGNQIAKGAAYAGVETFHVARDVGAHVVTSAGAVAPILLSHSEGTAREAGFVVFNNLYAAQLALQMVHHPKPYVMSVDPAPDPSDIFWRNVGLPHHARRSGILMSVSASSVLCLFWSVPMAFISSLTEIETLSDNLPRLGRFIENNKWTEGFVSQLAPLILLFFNEAILPVVLKYFAWWEGHISSAVLEASLFNKLGCFMIIQTFFVGAISGSVTKKIEEILDDPDRLLKLLTDSFLSQSSYFVQISLAMTFFLQSIEMLRLYPLFVAWLRRCFGPRLTARERRRTWGVLHALENPPDFWHAETFAQLILFYMVFFVYNAIAPATNFFLLLCFLLSEAGYRYQFIHNYPRTFDTGGLIWRTFILFTLVNMVIAQLTLFGLLAFDRTGIGGSAILPLLVITLLFSFFLYSKHSEVAKHLPTRNCILRDSENNAEAPMDMEFVKSSYVQPSLQQIVVEAQLDDDSSELESTASNSKSRRGDEV